MSDRTAKDRQANTTREQILTAAERLFAERGVVTVSNRQISEAAGQGNNTAVSYHFGSKAELVRAIVRRHASPIERAREQWLDRARASGEIRDWVGCLVRPVTEHLAELGVPSWYARFGAQVMTDPVLRGIMVEESMSTLPLREVREGLNRCTPQLPLAVHVERSNMAGQLIVHMCAERERRLAQGATTPKADWHGAATGLIDAITGMWLAPVTPPGGGEPQDAASWCIEAHPENRSANGPENGSQYNPQRNGGNRG
ncbi:TetR family transcriptional regulator [Streptomonospora sediminis]